MIARRTAAGLGLLVAAACALACALPRPAAAQTPPRKAKSAVEQAKEADVLVALLKRADQATEKKDFAAAAQALEEFIAIKPGDAVAHFQLGYAYTAMERLDDAKRAYTKSIELDPKLAQGHLNLGLILLETDPAAAVPPLKKAAELLANEARPHFLLGLAMERSGQLEKAIAPYRMAASLDAADYESRFALGRTLLALERHTEAEAQFRAALERQPDSAPARLGVASALHSSGKREAAAGEFAAYLKTRPDDTGARLRLATLYIELEQFDAALVQLDAAERGGLRTLDLYRMRADVHVRQNDFTAAAAALQQAIALAPADAGLRATRGRYLLELRDFPAAEADLMASLKLDASQLPVLRDLVTVFYLSEKWPTTLAAIDELAKHETLTAASWFIRGACYDKLQMYEQAIAAYQKFLELDRGKSERQDFQARHRVRTLQRMLERKRR